MHALGLLPLVKTLCVRNRIWSGTKFSLTLFNCRVLSQFSALTNLRELHICDLDIPSFMPGIKRYFGHFSPTVQSLHLKEPRGSRRQVIYFIGLFQNLQDLHLVYDEFYSHEQSIDDLDLTLVPPFVPPLQGFLMVWNSTKVGLLEDMIDLFGGIRFRRMLLFNVVGMPLLLAASAKSLQTVVLYPSDPRSKQVPFNGVQVLTNDFAAKFYLDPFDLSRSKSLHSLQIPASSIDRALKNGAAPRFLEHVLSTIRSPAFLQIIVIYWDSDFRYRSHSHKISPANRTKEASRHHKRFEVLREARKVREFQVVLRANVSGHTGKDRVRMLEEAIAEEKAKNGFGENFPEPLVSYVPWMYHTMVPVTL